jgi:uncharacterized protein
MAATRTIIDSDGHIFEDIEGIISHFRCPPDFAGSVRGRKLFPDSHVQYRLSGRPMEGAFGKDRQGRFHNPGPDGWLEFMEKTGVSSAVLFPSGGQRIGRIVDLDYAVEVAHAYNNWMAETYVQRASCFKGVAILPVHDPEAAVEELHRAYAELGMSAAVLPGTGVNLNLGGKAMWPIFAEADRLGCPLTVHGGGHDRLGMDTLNSATAANAIGHPTSLMIALGSMLFNGIFDRFPNVRVAFLEGGLLWFLTALERFEGSNASTVHYNPRKELLELPPGKSMREYILELVAQGRIAVGIEGDERDLPYALETVGPGAFMFSSDFPHEVSAETVRHELDELEANEDVAPDVKAAILAGNAERFYQFRN